MIKSERFPKWMHIVFPAIAMMLGWGLRGHIGGGPFGAMIPGAMVALSIGMLLELPAWSISILVVFGVFGIGMGGEMTYGQTLGILRDPETIWWGATGTTLKGAMWGLLGGAVLSLGFLFHKTSKKVFITASLLIILGMFIGFKTINDSMLIYFSDPENPRAESWAGLLLAAILLLVYLRIKISSPDFKLVIRFALFGMIGGALGFGLGSFWLVLGVYLPDAIFSSWWKAMEFSFGFLLGAFLGYASWLSRKEFLVQQIKEIKEITPVKFTVWKEMTVVLITGLLIYWLIPNVMEWFANTVIVNNMAGGNIKEEIARLLVNYAFVGLLFIIVLIRFPKAAWQIGITLTFCHTAIDLFRDFYNDINFWSPFTLHFFWVFLTTAIVAWGVASFSNKANSVRKLFLLLIWSCILISVLRMFVHPENFNVKELTFCQIICGRFVVDLFFVVSAAFLTWFLFAKIKPKAELM
ncbi:hypothetical protein GM418_25050 [Maribellus comscasis]|uniref:Uncharacterized protein n=1 Tax=Maribellus comscasis TaxID=2681766 RepID=A0A6I6JUL0_9BACT|nr:hypothetical protein [Maribellus comscasis]QGY46805.1 hypothetical protein GM418_25050 [Maribellus comscasis]